MNLLPKSKTTANTQCGFTLIELMISILIGLIILAAVTGMFVSMVRSDNDNLKSIRLNQELRSAMSLITRDLRRSGYNGLAATDVMADTPNPFQGIGFNIVTPPIINATCVLYAYDENGNGTDDGDSEHFGFRLNGGVIRIRKNSGLCSDADNTNWEGITDENLVQITAFNVDDPDLPGDDPEETVLPGKTVGRITTHQITITLTGQLVRDTSVSRTIKETVEIRNDEY